MASDPEILTPIISIPTTVPYPKLTKTKDEAGNETVKQEPGQNHVLLDVCSELAETEVSQIVYDDAIKLVLVANKQAQPIAFALRSNGSLWCLAYVHGSNLGWSVLDITPQVGSHPKVATFDAFADERGLLHIAVACVQDVGTCEIHHTSFALPDLSLESEASSRVITTVDTRSVEWSTLFKWIGLPNLNERDPSKFDAKYISTLTCGKCAPPITKSANWTIIVGSREGGDLTGAYLSVDPSPESSAPWTTRVPSGTTTQCLDLQPSRLSGYVDNQPQLIAGLFALNETSSDHSRFIEYQSWDSSGNVRSDSRVGHGSLGTPNSITSHLNPWGLTDLFVAGSKGIGVFLMDDVTTLSTSIMPDVSFSQVVTSEEPDPLVKGQSKLSIFALSSTGQLYFIQGTRSYQTHEITLAHSGLPIRDNVQKISCQYNHKHNSDQLLYTTKGQTKLRLLARAPNTSSWNETDLAIFMRSQGIKTRAYITTITVRSSDNVAVVPNYPLSLTSEPLFVTVNGQTRQLSHADAEFQTDTKGKVKIVLPVNGSELASPVYSVKPNLYAPSSYAAHSVYPAQRVMRQLNRYQSVPALKGAETTKGESPLAKADDDKLDSSVKLLQQYSGMMSQVDSNASQSVLGKSDGFKNVSIEKDDKGEVRHTDGNWFTDMVDEVVHEIGEFIGDVIEWLKDKFKAVFKLLLKIEGPFIRFAAWVGGKLFSFLIKAVGPLIRSIVSFIDDVLGTNLSDLLGIFLDVDKTIATQKHYLEFFDTLETKTLGFMDTNRVLIEDGFHLLKENLEKVIKDKRPDVKSASTTSDNFLLKLLGNPIITNLMKYNPIEWMLESYAEEYGDMVEVPKLEGLSEIANDLIPSLAKDEIKKIWDIVSGLIDIFTGVAVDNRDDCDKLMEKVSGVFWNIFDAVKIAVLAAYDIVCKMMKAAFQLATGTWKIPILTDMWDAVAEDSSGNSQPFSLVNALTYVLAAATNVAWKMAGQSGMPFDTLPHPKRLLDGWDEKNDNLHDILGIPRRDHNVMLMAHASPNANAMPIRITAVKDTRSKADALKDYQDSMQIAQSLGIVSRAFLSGMSLGMGIRSVKNRPSNAPRKDFMEGAFKDGQWDNVSRLMQAPRLMCGMLGMGSRIVSASALQKAWTHDELRKDLKGYDLHNWGIMVPTVVSVGAMLCQGMAGTSGSRGWGIIGNILLGTSALTEQICLDIAQDLGATPGNEGKIITSVYICLASTCSLATQGLSAFDQVEYALFAAAGEGTFSSLAIAGTIMGMAK